MYRREETRKDKGRVKEKAERDKKEWGMKREWKDGMREK